MARPWPSPCSHWCHAGARGPATLMSPQAWLWQCVLPVARVPFCCHSQHGRTVLLQVWRRTLPLGTPSRSQGWLLKAPLVPWWQRREGWGEWGRGVCACEANDSGHLLIVVHGGSPHPKALFGIGHSMTLPTQCLGFALALLLCLGTPLLSHLCSNYPVNVCSGIPG